MGKKRSRSRSKSRNKGNFSIIKIGGTISEDLTQVDQKVAVKIRKIKIKSMLKLI